MNDVKLKSEARAKIEMDMETFLANGGVITSCLMDYSFTTKMSKAKQAKEAWKHNTANPA